MDARFLRQISDYKRFAEQCRNLAARATRADDKAILDEMRWRSLGTLLLATVNGSLPKGRAKNENAAVRVAGRRLSPNDGMTRPMSISETAEDTISGLLQKRREIVDQIAMKREQISALADDVEGIDRVLEQLGYTGMLEAVPQLSRRVVFYRGQLRAWLVTELRKRGPATSRALAERLANSAKGYDR